MGGQVLEADSFTTRCVYGSYAVLHILERGRSSV